MPKEFILRKNALNGQTWNAYRLYHRNWPHPQKTNYGLYAQGFESLDHLMDWLFAGAPGRKSDYRVWKQRKAM